MDRTGQTYRHKVSGALIVVVKSKSMSSGTTRHTVLILDEAKEAPRGRKAGDQVEIDEVPVSPWMRNWEAV
jgi:hypothetical protein